MRTLGPDDWHPIVNKIMKSKNVLRILRILLIRVSAVNYYCFKEAEIVANWNITV